MHGALVSHFDNCHHSESCICKPVRGLSVIDICNKGIIGVCGKGDNNRVSSDKSEDMPRYLKRLKRLEIQYSFESRFSCARDPSMDQPFAPDGLPHLHGSFKSPVYIDSECTTMNMDLLQRSPSQVSSGNSNDVIDTSERQNKENVSSSPEVVIVDHKPEEMKLTSHSDIRNKVPDDSATHTYRNLPVPSEELVAHEKEGIQVRAKFSESAPGIKSDKSIKKSVSMIEHFTAKQLKEHISSLGWCTDQEVGENTNAHGARENLCQLCGMENLSFAAAPIYCSSCDGRIKPRVAYYCTPDGSGTCHCFCTSCYRKARGSLVTLNGTVITKAVLDKKRNDEENDEPWVQCDKCDGWQHQICALFNDKMDLDGKAEFICPNCYLKEMDMGKHRPLPSGVSFSAKELPRSKLSDHIEKRLFRRLKEEREDRAEMEGKSIDEVPGVEDLVVRVVFSINKQLKVGKWLSDMFHDVNYPSEFPYRSKVILLFQKIEGVDVCLFAMFVQEFGSECHHPNQRCVYISYLDSVKYFRPETKTVTGEALRTLVYHEILIGYLDYCKKRGFASCFLWACPPVKGEDYILHCHPEIQKTPKSDKLRQWYESMLRKAGVEVITNLTNLYDQFFELPGDCNTKVTASRLPLFDGDYWSGVAEDMIRNIEEESGEGLQKKVNKLLSERSLKAMGQTNQSNDAAKDILLMDKLGQTILPMKEDFIVAHLQFVCTHCHKVILSGSKWCCSQCRNFQLCERCHNTELGQNQINAHVFNKKGRHIISEVLVKDIPFDTEDNDICVNNDFFDNRQAFLSFCQENHYQFDTLRQSKHSSMMILYHLHQSSVVSVRGTESKEEAKQRKAELVRELLNTVLHSSQCSAALSHPSSYPRCLQIKRLFHHASKCSLRVSGGCQPCKKAWLILIMHSKRCGSSDCKVPRCSDLKREVSRRKNMK